MERKLASIRIISDIRPIEGADKIELVSVGGWNVVVAKEVGHKVGDMVVYCEIDSFLPIREEFEFLRKTSYKKMGDQEGFRLKTIKLRGQVSQGLILPIHILPLLEMVREGQDVSEMLGIVKYEPPIPAELAGKVKGGFPSFIPKTDEERVQNISVEYSTMSYRSDHQFYVTEKLDGSSATYFIKDGEFGVCSRNLELLETESNTFWKVARELKIEEKLRAHGKNVAVQGELIGEGIQGNPYKVKGHTVMFFNLHLIDEHRRATVNEFLEFVDTNDLSFVPFLEIPANLPRTVEGMLKYAEGSSVLNRNTEREGVVVRSMDNTISFKAISNNFLLNEK